MDPAASFLANSAPWTAQPGDPSMMNVNQPGPMTGPPPDMGQPNSMPVGVQQDQGQGMDPELHAAAVHHSRLAGILDKVGDILGGNKTLRLTQNPDGSVDATPMDSTRGEKWGRVAQAALKGAATGFAVGQGPGGQGRAAAASTLGAMGDVQVQQDKTIADAMKSNDQNQRRKLFDANMAMLHQQLVKATFDNKANRVKFSQDQTAFNLDLRNKLTAIGATQAIRYKDPEDLATQFTTNPDAKAAHLGKAGMILPVDEFDKDGYVTGGTAWILPEDQREQLNEVAVDVPYTKIDKDGNTVVEMRHVEKGLMKKGDIFAAWTGALNQGNNAAQTGHQMKMAAKQVENQTKQVDTAASIAPSTIAENYAAAEEHRANAVAKPLEVQQHGQANAATLNFLDKNYVTRARATEESWKVIDDTYKEYLRLAAQGKSFETGAEAKLALSRHLQTTFGAVKGGRLTKDMIQEHLHGRGVTDELRAFFQKAYNGDDLSPNQWKAFHKLVGEARQQSWQSVVDASDARGVTPQRWLPADLGGDPSTVAIPNQPGIAPPAAATQAPAGTGNVSQAALAPGAPGGPAGGAQKPMQHSIATAMAMPMNKGKSQEQVKQELINYGYEPIP